jgi:hypothetical protein
MRVQCPKILTFTARAQTLSCAALLRDFQTKQPAERLPVESASAAGNEVRLVAYRPRRSAGRPSGASAASGTWVASHGTTTVRMNSIATKNKIASSDQFPRNCMRCRRRREPERTFLVRPSSRKCRVVRPVMSASQARLRDLHHGGLRETRRNLFSKNISSVFSPCPLW